MRASAREAIRTTMMLYVRSSHSADYDRHQRAFRSDKIRETQYGKSLVEHRKANLELARPHFRFACWLEKLLTFPTPEAGE